MKNLYNQKFLGFTLAEILISLGIIGIIAALTIPTLVKDYQDKALVTGLKRNYSLLSQAYTSAINDNGPPSAWTDSYANTLSKYLKVQTICNSGWIDSTHPNQCAGVYHTPSGSEISLFGEPFILNDGTILVAATINSDCAVSRGSSSSLKAVCGNIIVDINGQKGPNQSGKDLFGYWTTKYNIIPFGGPDANSTFDNTCKAAMLGYSGDTQFCASWVLTFENLNYLYCPNSLSWDGSHTCP